jgi:hypothetical protein
MPEREREEPAVSEGPSPVDNHSELATFIDELIRASGLSANRIATKSRDRQYRQALSTTNLSGWRNGSRVPDELSLAVLLEVAGANADQQSQAKRLMRLVKSPPKAITAGGLSPRSTTTKAQPESKIPQPSGVAVSARRINLLLLLTIVSLLAADSVASTTIDTSLAPESGEPGIIIANAEGRRARATFYPGRNEIILNDTSLDSFTSVLDYRIDGKPKLPVHNPNGQYQRLPGGGRRLNPGLTVDLTEFLPFASLEFRACVTQSPPDFELCGPWKRTASARPAI